jgi:hypothetical protein
MLVRQKNRLKRLELEPSVDEIPQTSVPGVNENALLILCDEDLRSHSSARMQHVDFQQMLAGSDTTYAAI